MIPSQNESAGRTNQAAMFIDYDNLYAILKSQSGNNKPTSQFGEEIFDEVRRYLEEGDDTPTTYARAYGTYDKLPDDAAQAPSELHRRGIQPVHVPAAMQNNTSEVQLTIDVTQFLAAQPDVRTVVIVTGNRPYLPLVRWIREQGYRPLVAAVNPPQTSDTPSFAEDHQYLDARNLLNQDSRDALLANAPENGAAYTRPQNPADPPPQQYQELNNPTARRAVEITEEHFGQYDEVYLTPLLRKLSDILGPDHDPKSLVSELEAAGAARLEKRNGYPYNYTVLIVNDDHPDVQEIHNHGTGEATTVEAETTVDSDPEPVDSPSYEESTQPETTSSADESGPDEEIGSPSPSAAEEESESRSLNRSSDAVN